MAIDVDADADNNFFQLQTLRSPRPGIGPLEVLRVALMQGDLDDLRNDLARALRRSDIEPAVLECLLYGLRGIGIDLENARKALALTVTEREMAVGCRAHGTYGESRGTERDEASAASERARGDAQRERWGGERLRQSSDQNDSPQAGVREGPPYIGHLSSSSLQTCELTPTTTESPARYKSPHVLSQPRGMSVGGGNGTTGKENAHTSGGASRTSVDIDHRSKKTVRRKRSGVKKWATKR